MAKRKKEAKFNINDTALVPDPLDPDREISLAQMNADWIKYANGGLGQAVDVMASHVAGFRLAHQSGNREGARKNRDGFSEWLDIYWERRQRLMADRGRRVNLERYKIPATEDDVRAMGLDPVDVFHRDKGEGKGRK